MSSHCTTTNGGTPRLGGGLLAARRPPPLRHGALAFGLALAAAAAQAHDTWLEERSRSAGAGVELALTTGAMFPGGETPVQADALLDRGCITTAGTPVVLAAGRLTQQAQLLRAAPTGRRAAGAALRSCQVQTVAFDVEVPPPLVPMYLREIGAPPQLHAAWHEQQRQGLPWIERYTKHARISFAGANDAAQRAIEGAPEPGPATVPMALEIEIEAVERLRAGQVLHFRVLRDGRPLAGQAVELRGDASRLGLWRRTDAEGRAAVPVPLAGRWVLRATDLRPRADQPGHWESRFVTHTFTVAADEAAASGALKETRLRHSP